MEFKYKLTLNEKLPQNSYHGKNLCSKCYTEVYENLTNLTPSAVEYSPTVVKEIIKETKLVVKVRCQYCSHLYNEVLDKCPHCGGRS
jgi:DNA-directed RNA polymerase subunit RPC12/RpoP